MSATLAVSGLLTSSTGSALLRKVLFQVRGVGLDGTSHTFEKPWFTTWESAAACWVSIVIFWLMHRASFLRPQSASSEADADQTEPLLTAQEEETEEKPTENTAEGSHEGEHSGEWQASWKEIWALSVPGGFSVISIIIQGMGLRYVSASVSMMLSGSCIIFTAILSVTLLKCRLNSLHLTGVALTLGGVLIVSVANLVWPEVSHSTHHHNLLQGKSGTGEVVLGIGLTLLAMLILAMRLVSEEFALRGTKLHPLQVLGYEGMWGTLGIGILGLPLARLLPGVDIGGCQENTSDSFVMLFSNANLNIINLVFCLSVVGLNVFGLMVTSRLGSVFRAVLLTARTASVWALDLVLFYLHVGGGSVGEPWANPASWMQLFGFTLLLLGTVIYAQGSSAVAQHDDERKLADNSDAEEGPTRPPPRVSAVTRLRPYTSLYIPHGPHDIRPRTHRGDLSQWRSSSLPQEVLAGSSPLLQVPEVFQSHSYTPGLIRGSSPRSMRSTSSDEAGRPGSLFMQTLTHSSSWVLPASQLRRRGSHSVLDRLAEEGQSPSAIDEDKPSSSRSLFNTGPSLQAPLLTVFGDEAQSSGGEPETAQLRLKPQLGQSPSPQNLLQYRKLSRKSASKMPALEESGSETLGQSLEEVVKEPQESANQSGQQERSPQLLLKEDRPDVKQKPVFGQSPTPEILLSKRSKGKSKASGLPAFTEGEEGPRSSMPDEGPTDQELLRKLSASAGSISASRDSTPRSGILGQSPTPAKLAERRSVSAKSRASGRLPAFQEAADLEEGSESSSELDTSGDENATLRQGTGRVESPEGSSSSEDEDPDKPATSRDQGKSDMKKAIGGSSTSLQWNGEPMSL